MGVSWKGGGGGGGDQYISYQQVLHVWDHDGETRVSWWRGGGVPVLVTSRHSMGP